METERTAQLGRQADLAAVRVKALEELGLSVGSEGNAIAVGEHREHKPSIDQDADLFCCPNRACNEVFLQAW